MTKKEVQSIIAAKATGYGFKLEENGVGWFAERTDIGYISIRISEVTNDEKTDWEGRKVWTDIKASAFVCHMGGTPTPQELLAAADEIARAARMVAEIQDMKFSFVTEF